MSSVVVDKKSSNFHGAPTLTPPLACGNYVVEPALGAEILALIAKAQSEQRRTSAENRAMQTELTCASINEQADDIRSKAITGLVFGIVTSSLSIGQAVATSCTMQKGLNQIKEQPQAAGANQPGGNQNNPHNMQEMVNVNANANPNANPNVDGNVRPNVNNPNAEIDVNPNANPNANAEAKVRHNAVDIQNQQMLLNQKISMQNAVFSAATTSLSKTGDAISGFMDEDIKRSDISIERSRANIDALRALEESSLTVISKALAAMDAIQSSTNQAMQRILG